VQRLKEQLKESQRMIEEMNLHWQEQLREQVRRMYVWMYMRIDISIYIFIFALYTYTHTLYIHTHIYICM
jgi:hypothetical protein